MDKAVAIATTRRLLAETEAFAAEQGKLLLLAGFTDGEVHRAMEPVLSFIEGLKEELEEVE